MPPVPENLDPLTHSNGWEEEDRVLPHHHHHHPDISTHSGAIFVIGGGATPASADAQI